MIACAAIPAGCADASQTRSRRRCPPGRNRQAAMNTTRATTKITVVTRRLPNSTHRWISGSPVAPDATRLAAVHLGQSVQPSPDWVSLTAAPVGMIASEATTPASASLRIARGDGLSTAADSCLTRSDQNRDVPRLTGEARSGAGTDAGRADTAPIVWPPDLVLPLGLRRSGAAAARGARTGHDHAADRQPLRHRECLAQQRHAEEGGNGGFQAHPD